MSTLNADYQNSTDKIFKNNKSASKLRILIGIVGLLVVAVIGIVIPLIVVSNNNNDNGSAQNGGESGGQTGGQTLPNCLLNSGSATPELDKANCILDSYPLVDGWVHLPLPPSLSLCLYVSLHDVFACMLVSVCMSVCLLDDITDLSLSDGHP